MYNTFFESLQVEARTDIEEEKSNTLERTNAFLNTIGIIVTIIGTVANYEPWPPGQTLACFRRS
jgi:hypothetical protein